jgi:mono/diheme cytochrome c family protein
VELPASLDVTMAQSGKQIYEVKCASCHKLTDERLVGPGWKGVSNKHKPEWIMNFITNPDAMIDKDPELQAQLEICLVRMPNQSLGDDDARHLVEFMRQNDGVK